MNIELPEYCLVLMVGTSGAGKSTFAAKHFAPTEVISSDRMRAQICDDENDQSVTEAAFEVLHLLVEKRLEAGRFTVVDATNLHDDARRPLLALAKKCYCPVYAIVLQPPLKVCLRRQGDNSARTISADDIRDQFQDLQMAMSRMKHEGIKQVFRFAKLEEVEGVSFTRIDRWADVRNEGGPFDLIGDVHGCYIELLKMLDKLGYHLEDTPEGPVSHHPQGRRLIYLGDLVDRGPQSPAVLRLVMASVKAGTAFCVPGNHDIKLIRKLKGNDVTIRHGLAETLEQLEAEPEEFKQQVIDFFWEMRSHLILDEGRLIAVHAGLKDHYIGRSSKRIWSFSLYGDVTGEQDEYGLPIRGNWAADYHGDALIVYGHTPLADPWAQNNTICIDTGCVFGGRLTAFRYPERELVDVKAATIYYEPTIPLAVPPTAESEM